MTYVDADIPESFVFIPCRLCPSGSVHLFKVPHPLPLLVLDGKLYAKKEWKKVKENE